MYKRLDRLYCKDISKMINVPPLSCGIELKSSFEKDQFRLNMFSAYKTLESRFGDKNYVSLDNISCISCRYNLSKEELYNNMLRIRDYVTVRKRK